jgi:PAS domain S-box-containing protein
VKDSILADVPELAPLLIDAVPDGVGVMVFDARGSVVSANRTLADRIGHTTADAVGRQAQEFLPLDGYTGAAEVFKSVAGGSRVTLRNMRYDGTNESIYDVFMSPLGRVAAMALGCAWVRDVTDRYRVQALALESEERFTAMADCSPILLWMSGTDANCTFFNHTWLAFTGRKLEQERGVGWAEGVHCEDLQACLAGYLDAFARREPFELEYRLRRADGEYRWLLDRGAPRYDAAGRFLGFIGSCVDISDVRTTQQALRKSQLRLRSILDAATESIIGLRPDGSIDAFNAAAERMFGFRAEEVLGEEIETLLIEPNESEKAPSRILGHPSATSGELRDMLGRHRDGSIFPVELSIGPRGARTGDPRTMVVRDRSFARNMERRLLEGREKVQREISQDLHDGLGQLLTGAALLLKDLEETAAPESLKVVSRVVGLLNQSIAQVRTIAAGLNPVRVDGRSLSAMLGELLNETEDTFGIETLLDVSAGADSRDPTSTTQLYLIAREAIHNALRHGKATTISLALTRLGSRSLMTITDDGIGFSERRSDGGLGIPGMQYRARVLRGFLDVVPRAAPERGTIVRCSWTPEEEEAAAEPADQSGW